MAIIHNASAVDKQPILKMILKEKASLTKEELLDHLAIELKEPKKQPMAGRTCEKCQELYDATAPRQKFCLKCSQSMTHKKFKAKSWSINKTNYVDDKPPSAAAQDHAMSDSELVLACYELCKIFKHDKFSIIFNNAKITLERV